MLCLLKTWERVEESPSLAGLGIRAHTAGPCGFLLAAGPASAGSRRLLGGRLHPASQTEQRAAGSARPHPLRLSAPDVGEPDRRPLGCVLGALRSQGWGRVCQPHAEWPCSAGLDTERTELSEGLL